MVFVSNWKGCNVKRVSVLLVAVLLAVMAGPASATHFRSGVTFGGYGFGSAFVAPTIYPVASLVVPTVPVVAAPVTIAPVVAAPATASAVVPAVSPVVAPTVSPAAVGVVGPSYGFGAVAAFSDYHANRVTVVSPLVVRHRAAVVSPVVVRRAVVGVRAAPVVMRVRR